MEEEELQNQEAAAAAESNAAEVPPTPTNRDRLRGHFGEEEFADDEGLYGKAADHIGELRQWRESREASDKEVIAMLKQHPKIAQLLQYLAQGASEIEALSRVFDSEDLIRYEEEPDYEQWAEGKKKREADIKAGEESKAKYDLNYQASQASVDEFCTEQGLNDEARNELLDKVFAVYDDMIDGNLSKETLMLFHKGINHDEDVADAEAQGVITGKNTKIDEKKQQSIKGDGLPEDNGSAAVVEINKPKKEPMYKTSAQAAQELIEETRNKKKGNKV